MIQLLRKGITLCRYSAESSPMHHAAKYALVLALCSHCLSVPASSEADKVVARVNGESIRKSHYGLRRGYLEKHLSRKFRGKDLKEELARQERHLLTTLIEERMLRQRLEELGVLPEMEVIKYLDRVRREHGLNDLASLERFLIQTGVDPKEFKDDVEQRLVRDSLRITDVGRLSNISAAAREQDSTKAGTNTGTLPLQPKGAGLGAQRLPHGYVQGLRRSSIIEVKHGFFDTGVHYTGDLDRDVLIAARGGDTLKIRMLLANGANPNAVAANGYSGLMHAAEMGHKETVATLLAGGAQPNAQNHSGDTALLLATVEGYEDIANVLLARGADANVQDADGMTPLIHASTKCQTELVNSLLERKIDVNSGDKTGRTALMAATTEGCRSVVLALVAWEADPNVVDQDGRGALVYAVESGREHLIQFLLENGARVNARDNKGKTALIYAVIAERLDLIRQLFLQSADVNLMDKEDQTPLMYAASGGSEQIVQALLDAGADTKAQTWSLNLARYDSLGLPLEVSEPEQQRLTSAVTALEIAKRKGHRAVVERLQKVEDSRQ